MTTPRTHRPGPVVLLVAATAAAVALATAPVAAADGPDCLNSSGLRTCTKDGHSSMRVTPAPRSNLGQLFSPNYVPGFGQGIPIAPVLG